MSDRLLHTPEGVRDIYDRDCEKKLAVEERMRKIIAGYGYSPIQTPMFEYFDIFSKERGTVPSRQMYKFIDRDGSTLVLRPDITPSVARCVSKYYRDEELPLRLSYVGETFINNAKYQGKLKENTQVGAELINFDSAIADAEMVVMSIECLLAAGLTEFQVELGNAAFFNSIMTDASFEKDEIEEFRDLMEEKNLFGAERLVSTKDVPEKIKELIIELPKLFGSHDIIDYARTKTDCEDAIKALDRLDSVYEIIRSYGYDRYVSFDLGMVNQYNYYTGIIIKALTFGTGTCIASGGRYDRLLCQFNKSAPAIGIVVLLDQVMIALSRQKIDVLVDSEKTMVLYEADGLEKALSVSRSLRSEGVRVCMVQKEKDRQDYVRYAAVGNIGKIVFVDGSGNTENIEIRGGVKEA